MYRLIGLARYKFLVPIIILIAIIILSFNQTKPDVLGNNEGPIYDISISERTQNEIWELCEANEFSYEMMLSIYEVEGVGKIRQDDMKTDLENLVYYRNYWGEQGYPDEYVFDLVLISRLRGIEGSRDYMKYNDEYDLYEYVQAIAEYKSYLEQSRDLNAASI